MFAVGLRRHYNQCFRFFLSALASDERMERVVVHARLPANKGSTSDEFSLKISTWVAMHRTSRLREMGSGKTEPWGFNPIHITAPGTIFGAPTSQSGRDGNGSF